jgi:Sporulation and spore germination
MPRDLKIALGILAVAVAVGLISLRGLHRRMQGLAESQSSDQKARREVLAPKISTPSDVAQGAKIYWAAGEDRVTATTEELALSADPVQRGKQVLQALIADAPTAQQRTIPADSELLAFYILSDGTAIADFSDALSSETPSGIESEQLVVDSIARTLENNVPTARRLKILIHGQEVETLAGHIDLTGFFDLNPPNAAPSTPAPSSAAPPASAPQSAPTHPKTLAPGGAPRRRR